MTMTNRHYQLLVAISTFESQIHALTQYSAESCDCFTLLQVKLDELCAWILQEKQQTISDELGYNPEYDRQLKNCVKRQLRLVHTRKAPISVCSESQLKC